MASDQPESTENAIDRISDNPCPLNDEAIREAAWISRLLTEKDDLQVKIRKLDEFIEMGKEFPRLAVQDQELLRRQLDAMLIYRGILSQRIARLPASDSRKPSPIEDVEKAVDEIKDHRGIRPGMIPATLEDLEVHICGMSPEAANAIRTEFQKFKSDSRNHPTDEGNNVG